MSTTACSGSPMREECGKQITTADGRAEVTMRSGAVVPLGRCNLTAGHLSPCGRSVVRRTEQ